MTSQLYINGEKSSVSHIGTTFQADSKENPGIRNVQHQLTLQQVFALSRGETVFNGGNSYSMYPDINTLT